MRTQDIALMTTIRYAPLCAVDGGRACRACGHDGKAQHRPQRGGQTDKDKKRAHAVCHDSWAHGNARAADNES